MRVASVVLALIAGVTLSLSIVLPAYPHGGGLDAYGCHNNRKAGGYHCHRGPLAGEVFSSKAEMLERLKKASSTAEAAPDKRRR
jgi:hypothetical protein